MEKIPASFIKEMMKVGVLTYDEQDTLWRIAQRCAKTAGMTVGIPTAIATANVGAVMIPGIGSVPGAVAGFLAGFAGGTTSCVIANVSLRPQIRLLLNGMRDSEEAEIER